MRTSSVAAKTGTLTTTEAAVLALLATESAYAERSAYDLLKAARRTVGLVWTPAKSHLYGVLPRLVRSGLAQSRPGGRDRGPDRQLYRVTEAGAAALRAWLEWVEPDRPERFYLRVFYGHLMSRGALIAQYEQFRRDTEARLAEYRALEKSYPPEPRGADVHHRFLLRLGIGRAVHALRWVDGVLSDLRKKR